MSCLEQKQHLCRLIESFSEVLSRDQVESILADGNEDIRFIDDYIDILDKIYGKR